MNKKLINSLSEEEFLSEIIQMGQAQFRARQVRDWLYKCVDFSMMRNIPKDLIGELEQKYIVDNVKIHKKQVSKIDGTGKYLLKLYDGEMIEAAAMEYKHGMTICVSTQVGCAMGCRFCSSAAFGMKRNLSAHEMLAQVMQINRDVGKSAANVVLMGAGEPLQNYDNVMEFIHLLHKQDGLNMSYRNISLSTCGIVEKIVKLSEEQVPINLCVSLHWADDEKRSSIMPIAKKYKIEDIVAAADEYFSKTGRRITYEYALIEGENDTKEEIDKLVDLLKGKNVLVNLIPLNHSINSELKGVPQKKAYSIMEYMISKSINATVRRTLGADIDGACGQLRAGEINT